MSALLASSLIIFGVWVPRVPLFHFLFLSLSRIHLPSLASMFLRLVAFSSLTLLLLLPVLLDPGSREASSEALSVLFPLCSPLQTHRPIKLSLFPPGPSGRRRQQPPGRVWRRGVGGHRCLEMASRSDKTGFTVNLSTTPWGSVAGRFCIQER